MKILKLLAIVLVFSLCIVSFAACSNGKNNANSNTTNTSNESASSVIAKFTKGKNGYTTTAAKKITAFEAPADTAIICWGSSSTEGMNMTEGYSYPAQLQANLNGQFKVINAGVSGETSTTVTARANAIDAFLAEDIVFEKGQSSIELERDFLYAANGQDITFKGFSKSLPFNKINIGTQSFMVIYKKSETWDTGTYTIVRDNENTQLTLKKGTKVSFDYSELYKNNYCNVILMGGNDGAIGTPELIAENYGKIGATSDKNIYIIQWNVTDEKRKALKEAFGEQALDPLDYMVNNAMDDYGMIPTELDSYCAKKNIVPVSFHLNNDRWDVHLNELGYKVLADLVYKKGVELGYWK